MRERYPRILVLALFLGGGRFCCQADAGQWPLASEPGFVPAVLLAGT